ncbi:MAG: AAA family ATPase [Chloroflexia bacterium]
MQAIIFTGLQASGKSTFYRERFLNTHIRLNLDMLRTRTRESILLRACLEAKQPFVIDNTNPSMADRARYIEPALAAQFSVIGYYFLPEPTACIARNAARPKEQRVPNVAIYGAVKRMQPPTMSEGFTEIYAVRVAPFNTFVVEPLVDNE